MTFNEKSIKVIRMGLHSGGNVEEGYVAGVYHPAFRELCESRLYLEKCREIIKNRNIKGNITIYVSPTEISKMTGQKRSNLESLQQQGVYAKVKPDEKLAKYVLRIEE